MLAGLVQAVLFAYATGPGLAGTSDSTYYLHAAGTLRELGRLLHPDGSPYRYWPPLYPALVAAAGSLPVLRLLQGGCLVVSLLVWSWLGRQLLPPLRAGLLAWALAFATPWLVVSKFVWGETVFILLFAAYTAALYQWLRTQRSCWLALATLAGGLLPLQRTIGFFLLAGVGMGLLIWAVKNAQIRRGVVLHLGLSALGGLAWHYYALLLAAPTVYQINRGWGQFFGSAADFGFVLNRWLLPLRPEWRVVLPTSLWGFSLLGLLVFTWPRGKMLVTAQGSGLASVFPRLLWGSLLSFLVLIIVATTFTRSAAGLHDAERYASVLFAPVLLLVLRQLPVPQTAGARWLVGAGLALWLGYAAARAGTNAQALRRLPTITASHY
jgi:hypothetical protein